MRRCIPALLCVLFVAAAAAQSPDRNKWDDATGLYSFRHDSETVQLIIEHGELSGYITRMDHGQRVDQQFEQGEIDGDHVTWTARPMHGTTFHFDGTISRSENSSRTKRGFYRLKGRLTTTEEHKKESSRDITMESLPQFSEQ